MAYTDVTIYFMTGTGNSFRAATWMGDMAAECGMCSRVISIEAVRTCNDIPEGVEHLVGLVTPTHGFTAPWHMLRFVLQMPRRSGTHAYIVPTRGATKLWSLILPGMEGIAGYLLALILMLKGYTVRGVMGLDMPSNWTALHCGVNQHNAQVIISRARHKAETFMEIILTGGRYFSGFIPLLIGMMLLPLTMLYLIIGRFYLAKLMFASHRCTGCGLCIRSCPKGAIKMLSDGHPYWTYRCENCMRCMAFCPEEAVEASHSLGVFMYYLMTMPAAVYAVHTVFAAIISVPAHYHWVHHVLQYVSILPAIFFSYLVFTVLSYLPLFRRLFAYTTLTHFYRRYHEPDAKLSDIIRNRQ